MSLVDDAVYDCVQRTKLVVRHLKEYTLHDDDHLFRVLALMERLIPQATLKELSIPELMLLILSAFFHDVGMAPAEDEVKAWLQFWDESVDVDGIPQGFALFAKAKPDRLDEISDFESRGLHSQSTLLKEYLVAEYIRSTHADRARTIIGEDWSDRIIYRDTNLSVELAALCFSHVENAVALLNLDAALSCGPDDFACLPFLGVILRLADILDFDAKRTPSVLFSHIGVKHPVSLLEWKKHRQISSWQINSKRIAFSAQCEHPAIEAAIHRFCDIIDKELVACSGVVQNISDPSRDPFPLFYKIGLPASVDRARIQAKKNISGKPLYRYRDSQFRLNHSQVIDLLMGTRLYGDPAVAIREVVQNSIDACLVRKALERKWRNPYEPRISIKFNKEDGREMLQIVDNGIGMDQEILDKYYATIGSSFYKSGDFYALQAQHQLNFQPISRFGIGILSCFMVASSICVNTRRLLAPHSSGEPLEVRIEGLESIFWVSDGSREQPGTETVLSLRPNHPWRYASEKEMLRKIAKLFPNPPFPISIEGLEEKEVQSGELFLSEIEHDWIKSSHVRQFNVSLNFPELGIAGQAAIAVLEEFDLPVAEKSLFTKNVTIEGEVESIALHTVLKASMNEIKRHSHSLEFQNEKVTKKESYSTEIKSEAEFAIHGISMPMELFPGSWKWDDQKTRLHVPFSMKIRLDVVGTRDLNLNTARNAVYYDEKWTDFAQTLYRVICESVRQQVSADYWDELVTVWNQLLTPKDEEQIFRTVLTAICGSERCDEG